jgi:hypothetical protein
MSRERKEFGEYKLEGCKGEKEGGVWTSEKRVVE